MATLSDLHKIIFPPPKTLLKHLPSFYNKIRGFVKIGTQFPKSFYKIQED